jgi:hypothetical protein
MKVVLLSAPLALALWLQGEPVERARALAPRVLEGRWEELSPRERVRFTEALESALAREEETDEEALVRRYRRECDRTIGRYSFEYLVGELEGKGVVVLEDFEDDPVSGLPRGWKSREFEESHRNPYQVVEENGNRFLRAEDRGENVMLYKEVRWDARKYPYIGFRWRIRAVPESADERFEERADSAAGVYLTYNRKLGLVPETVKFVWSGSVAAGAAFRRPGIGMPWTVVAGSGPVDEELWRSYVYHAGDVYQRTFAKTPVERPLGFGVLSDANSTGSFAAADYDDIVALESADAVDAIEEILVLSQD